MSTDIEVTSGESYYVAYGWSGCAGSAWSTLPPAVRDGWEAAARERAARARAWDEGKHSEHTAACRFGDIPDECTCPNPYRDTPDTST